MKFLHLTDKTTGRGRFAREMVVSSLLSEYWYTRKIKLVLVVINIGEGDGVTQGLRTWQIPGVN